MSTKDKYTAGSLHCNFCGKSQKEVKKLIKELRSKGFTTSERIYQNPWSGKYIIRMYGKWKKMSL